MADNNELVLTGDSSFEDIAAALAGETPKPEDKQAELAVTEPPADEPKEPETKEPETKPADTPEDKKPKRFSELSRKTREAEEKAARLQAELDSIKAAKPVEPAAPKELDGRPVEPKPEDFSDWQKLEDARRKYTSDLVAYEVKNALHQRDVEVEQSKQRERQQSVQDSWNAQVDEASEDHDNVPAAIQKVAKVVGKLGIVDVIKESEVGVKIVLELDKDADLLKKLGSMSIASAAREIGKIEARIQSATAAASAPAATPKPRLPEPPASVGGNPSNTGTARPKVEDLSIDELRKLGSKEGWYIGR